MTLVALFVYLALVLGFGLLALGKAEGALVGAVLGALALVLDLADVSTKL